MKEGKGMPIERHILANARPSAAPTDPKATPHVGQGSSPKRRSERALMGVSSVWPTSAKLSDIV